MHLLGYLFLFLSAVSVHAVAGLVDYAGSANRGSPLHRSDRNVTGLIGLINRRAPLAPNTN